MNDYKELIEKLRMAGRWIMHDDGSFDTHLLSVDDCEEAANAIEQLARERDAAVDDMDTIVKTPAPICVVCGGVHCEMCLKSEYNSGFEWRGAPDE